MAGTQCGECKKSFSKIGNLRAHVKRAHPDKLNVLAPKKTYAPVATCIECNNTFVNTSNLNAHIRTKHPDLIKNKAQCEICKSENKKSSAFCKHVKNHKNARRMNCSLCRVFSDSSKANLLEHYKQAHEIKLEYEEVAFSSFNEFLLWKQRIEKDTQASFVTMHGSSKTKSHTLIRYSCHRSGEFRRKGSNKRKLKKQGSNKIDAFCPASMKVTIKNERCEVVFQRSHVGHKQELRHLFLTSEERQKIASEIASKVPFDTILERVRNSVMNAESPRLNLLTKQDLYNIQKSLHLNREISHRDINLEDCINEMEENGILLKMIYSLIRIT
ncbi:zinc finger protein with KRAB and SCAN domains 4-like isoform X2 [Zophobas morio]|uniref:zinc finger protein with KRAB and SCAN domains 4-like isoform X2 n=1 Tax=Zophobas morio TaxID=2755281 RepID=UPI003083DCDA